MITNDSKSQKYFSVSRAILEIIEKGSFNDLTLSNISRHSKVSRAWIYEYMGKEKQDLIQAASDIFASYFTKLDTFKNVLTIEDFKANLNEGHEQAFLKLKDDPIIIKLYFRFKGTDTPIGTSIQKYEDSWLEFMANNLKTILKFDQKKAINASRIILFMRLGNYHHVASSKNFEIEHPLAVEVLVQAYQCVLNS